MQRFRRFLRPVIKIEMLILIYRTDVIHETGCKLYGVRNRIITATRKLFLNDFPHFLRVVRIDVKLIQQFYKIFDDELFVFHGERLSSILSKRRAAAQNEYKKQSGNRPRSMFQHLITPHSQAIDSGRLRASLREQIPFNRRSAMRSTRTSISFRLPSSPTVRL